MEIRGDSLRSVTASARIQAALRGQIIAMGIEPGAVLSEKQIALSYGVSRTPVREALLRLADERLVEIFAQYGTFVSRISMPTVRDAMVIRQALECVAVREAALHTGKEQAAMLRAILADQKAAHAASRLADFHEADEAFHAAISEIAGHPNLWRVVRQEKAQVDRCRILTLPSPERRLQVMADHAAIVKALIAGDPAGAEAALRFHLDKVLPGIEALAEAHPDYFEGGEPAQAPVAVRFSKRLR